MRAASRAVRCWDNGLVLPQVLGEVLRRRMNYVFILKMKISVISEISGNVAQDLANFVQI